MRTTLDQRRILLEARIGARAVHDAWLEASAVYWMRRAEAFEAAAPRPGDFVGLPAGRTVADIDWDRGWPVRGHKGMSRDTPYSLDEVPRRPAPAGPTPADLDAQAARCVDAAIACRNRASGTDDWTLTSLVETAADLQGAA